MHKETWLAGAAIFAFSTLAQPAAADSRTDQIARQSSAPMATQSENPAFEYSGRKILGYVSEARIAIGNEREEEAISYLNDAMRELDSIRNTRSYLEMMGVPFGRVLYGESGSYYIPIADDTYAVRTYARGPFWAANKTTAVRDVEIVNVDVMINPEKTTEYLQTAKQQITAGNYAAADNALEDLLEESIHETTARDQPFARLQDNIYLTRVLLRQQNYEGARYALRHAKSALADYENATGIPHGSVSTSNLRQEIDTLDDTIQRRDPTMLKQASDKVEEWWRDLKSWTREQTS